MPVAQTTADRAVLLSSLLRRSARLPAIRPGEQAHAQALAHGLLPDVTLYTDLLLLYSRCSRLDLARRLFDRMPHRNMHSWNILLSAYVHRSLHAPALALLPPFLHSGLRPDHFTLPSLLKACGGARDRSLGNSFHSWVIMLGLEDDVLVRSSVLDMHAKCGSLDSARYLFETMPDRDAVVWNSMISGFARAGLSAEALGLLRRSQLEGVEMGPMAVPSVLTACGGGGELMKGRQVHGKVIQCAELADVAVGNSLIDMYAKCGCVDDSLMVFSKMGERNLVTWSTLISCYGIHGKGMESLKLYKDMISQGFKPNCVTFTSVLSSCSHSGLVDEGRMVFESMGRDHGVSPSVEHYACMVDLLGRSGRIGEALELIETIPVEPTASVWGALLGACAMHRDVGVGEIAARRLFELEGRNASNYVALCGIYDAVGLWNGVSKIRARMRELGLVKTPGCSWISVKGRLHSFYQGDVSHPLSKRIHETLKGLESS